MRTSATYSTPPMRVRGLEYEATLVMALICECIFFSLARQRDRDDRAYQKNFQYRMAFDTCSGAHLLTPCDIQFSPDSAVDALCGVQGQLQVTTKEFLNLLPQRQAIWQPSR